VTDPLELIEAVRLRLARQAALRTLMAALPAAVVTALVAAVLRPLAAVSWERTGRALPAAMTAHLQLALLAAAGLGVLFFAILAYRAFRHGTDTLGAADLIDRRIADHQEMVTLATVTANAGQRSPLFPLLVERASLLAGKLNPVALFPFEFGGASRTALTLAVGALAAIATAVALLVVAAANPQSYQALQLRKLADKIAASTTSPQQQRLAEELKAAARALDSPRVPPQAKLEQLAAAQQALQQARQSQAGAGASQAAGGASRAAGSQARSDGQGQSGSGSGSQAQGEKGPGNGSGSGGARKNGANQIQMAEVQKNLAKAQTQLMEENAGGKAVMPRPVNEANAKGQGPKPKPGQNRMETASRTLPGNLPKADQGKREQRRIVSEMANGATSRKDSGSTSGDTHLGQMPQPGNFERFYKAGEKGPPVEIKNARYVLFRIPQTVISAGGGRTVIDQEHPHATVAFQNLPLGDSLIKAEPDERQLVPPRYRDLLR
jgi:hypothetical protein